MTTGNLQGPAQTLQMGVSQTNNLAAAPKPVDSPEEKKLKKAAGDFESILLASMWKAMKHSFGSSETDGADPAGSTLEDWGIEVMAGAVGRAGGLGIGKLILKSLEPAIQADKR